MSDTDEEPRDYSQLLKKRAKRGGAKDYMPDGSRKQNEAIDAARDAMFTLLREEESRKTSVHAAQGRLDRSTGLTTITRAKGTHLHVMGHTVSGGQLALYPEEALWLMSMRLLEVRDQANVPCSLQDYYQLVFAGHDRWINFEKYQVYAYLRRLGYIVQRHQRKPNPPPNHAAGSSNHGWWRRWLKMLCIWIQPWLWYYWAWSTRPLVYQRQCRSYQQVYSKLQVIRSISPHRPTATTSQEFHWDIYKPNPQWKKRDPGVADYRAVVVKARDAVPALSTYQTLFSQALPCSDRPIRYTQALTRAPTFLIAVVDDAEGVSFLRVADDQVADLSLECKQ